MAREVVLLVWRDTLNTGRPETKRGRRLHLVPEHR